MDKLDTRNVRLGKCLRIARKKKGLTQTELAKKINMSQTAYSNYENGYHTIPWYNLLGIAKALDVSVEFLLEQAQGRELDALIGESAEVQLFALIDAYETELALNDEFESGGTNLKWAGIGIETAVKLNRDGLELVRNFIKSALSNPALTKR